RLPLSSLFPYTTLFRSRVPGHLFAITFSTLLAWVLNRYLNADIATIGSMFSYTIDGVEKAGIPPVAPHFDWPWNYPNAEGQPVGDRKSTRLNSSHVKIS